MSELPPDAKFRVIRIPAHMMETPDLLQFAGMAFQMLKSYPNGDDLRDCLADIQAEILSRGGVIFNDGLGTIRLRVGDIVREYSSR